ncbi:MAG: hypothetical protein EKK29_07065 [Hyphomicrobiales bacterium]|nr:MAG: hypothetical protein EKK29_07065 [Hyphomicrobiales bacterium]
MRGSFVLLTATLFSESSRRGSCGDFGGVDALEIEALAKRRLADEYDAAQERKEIRRAGNPNSSKTEELPGPKDIGLTYKDIHEARQIRDAEKASPGIVRQTLNQKLEAGDKPRCITRQRAAVARCRS